MICCEKPRTEGIQDEEAEHAYRYRCSNEIGEWCKFLKKWWSCS